jgi:hypothetical protein
MGFYIEAPDGVNKQKPQYFHDHHGAELVLSPKFPTDGSVLVCIVDNGPFEAAGIAFVFNDPNDPRQKTWRKDC